MKLCPNSKIPEDFQIKAGAKRDGQYLVIAGEKAKEAQKLVRNWLQKIRMIQ